MSIKHTTLDRLLMRFGIVRANRLPEIVEAAAQEKLRERKYVNIDGAEAAHKDHPTRKRRCLNILNAALKDADLNEGTLLEIGPEFKPFGGALKQFRYYGMDLEIKSDAGYDIVVGDITNCPNLADASYDLVISIDVFEHIAKPWLAGQEIVRLLKPGGVTYHSTLFSWRYHPRPIDYWRYSPQALASLFPGLTTLHTSFDAVERRRHINDPDGEIPADELGGWRENIRVHYAGLKPKS